MYKIFIPRVDDDKLLIRKEAGPEIFFQRRPIAIGSLIVPSGSLDADPSNKTLSVGKVITWSGPAMEMGGSLFSRNPSQEVSFLQEIQITPAVTEGSNKKGIFFS